MRKSVLIFGVIALALAGGTVYFVQQWLKQQRADIEASRPKATKSPQKVVEKRPTTWVLVAKRPLPAGTFIQTGDLRWQSWPDAQVPQQYLKFLGQAPGIVPTKLIGSVVRRGISEGQPISPQFIVRSGERGFLAAVLRPGMRAVSIGVDDATGISGLVFPGDRVDVILTHEVEVKIAGTKEKITRRVSETIIVRVRVLAIDQNTDDLEGKPIRAKTVTLEVKPSQAEIVAVAVRMGSLTLSLRSLAKNGEGQEGDGAAGGNPKVTQTGAKLSKGCIPGSTLKPCQETGPERGKTFTVDSQFSRVYSHKGRSTTVDVVRGSNSKTVTPRTGGGSSSDSGSSSSGSGTSRGTEGGASSTGTRSIATGER